MSMFNDIDYNKGANEDSCNLSTSKNSRVFASRFMEGHWHSVDLEKKRSGIPYSKVQVL